MPKIYKTVILNYTLDTEIGTTLTLKYFWEVEEILNIPETNR